MARMIPPQIPNDCKSPGEREIFKRLKQDPATSNWIVLHSLDVAEHVTQIWGEIDFVVVVPHKGVLCLEVKACNKLIRNDGIWFYGNDPHPDVRGPFKQASDGMHSLRKWLADHQPGLSSVLFYSAVIFPYAPFYESDPEEWETWQVIDRRKFTNRPIGQLIMNILDSAREHVSCKPTGGWFRPELREPSTVQCDDIWKSLRPNFEYYEPRKSQTAKLKEELIRFTEEQFECLDSMEAQPRVAFKGPAGTGKTLLALEAAKRANSAGDKVLLVCFNRLLGDWLREETDQISHDILTGNIHQIMVQLIDRSKVPAEPSQSFWEEELPELAIETLIQNGALDGAFDHLLIDEAQDLLKPSYLDFLDLALVGGLASGKWRLFGDFEKQMIFGSGSMSLEEFIESRARHAPIFSLRINCRNTPRIATAVNMLAGLAPPYRRVRRPDNDIDLQALFYSNDMEQENQLAKLLESYYGEGIKGDSIVVLSSKSDPQSAPGGMRISPWKGLLKPIESATSGLIPYCTIHRFKGLERPVVILTDIDDVNADQAESLFYVGLTRATERVAMLASEKVKNQLVQKLQGK